MHRLTGWLRSLDRADWLRALWGVVGLSIAMVALWHLIRWHTFFAGVEAFCLLLVWYWAASASLRNGRGPRWLVGGLLIVGLSLVISPMVIALLIVIGFLVVKALALLGLAPDQRRIQRRLAVFWIERRAGLLLSIPLVILALFILSIVQIPERIDDTPVPMKILYEISQPEEEIALEEIEPDPRPEEPEPPPEFEVAATRINSQEDPTAELVDPAAGEPDLSSRLVLPDPIEIPEAPIPLAEWIPTTEEMAELSDLQRREAARTEALDDRHEALREYVIRQEVRSSARDFIVNSDGGVQGAIRLLDVEGFPRDVVIAVLRKYDITYQRSQVAPGAGKGFLNAAVTEEGTFKNTVSETGVYDVMILSNKAVHFMATAEVQALQARGYDPRTTRIMKIVFGIIMNDKGEYELGVTKLEVEQVR